MLYAIVGTQKAIREKAQKEMLSLGAATHHIYSEQILDLESLVDATSLFGDVVIVNCMQLLETSSSKEMIQGLLPSLASSPNIFIVDEPFATVHTVNRLTKVAKKIFDAREEKKKDVSVFALCDSFIKKDKKQAWIDFMVVKEKEEGEAICGALWWKFQTEWIKVREGKKSIFTEEECERIGGDLVRATILAHSGKKDLMIELERIILSL